MFDSTVSETAHFIEGMHLESGKVVTIPINDIRRVALCYPYFLFEILAETPFQRLRTRKLWRNVSAERILARRVPLVGETRRGSEEMQMQRRQLAALSENGLRGRS